MTTGRVAWLGFIAGSGFAGGVTVFLAARSAYTITRGRRWYQLKQL